MRFVELWPTPAGAVFRLHPRITWLRGLDPAARVAVVGLAHDLALGEFPEWDGIVEIDGEELPLHDAISRIGETADSALIIDAASLPEIASSIPAGEPVNQASLDEATAKLHDLEERIAGLAEELAASGKVRAAMTTHLNDALAKVDPDAVRRLDQADSALVGAAALADRPDPWTGMNDVPNRVEALRDRIVVLDERVAKLPSGDRPALAAAAATARAGLTSGAVPSPAAVALAQAWSSLHQRLQGLESRMAAIGGGTEAVAARLEQARLAASAAEEAAVARRITVEESANLERLHDAMIDAEQRAGRGMRRSAGLAAYEVAQAELQEVLAPLGYPTWAAFRMGNGLVTVSAEALEEYERASAALEAAEIDMATLMARLERDTELQEVLTAVDRAHEHAVELLGEDPLAGLDTPDPSVLTEALQAWTVDAAEVGVDRGAALSHLRDALAAAGAIGYEGLTSDAAIVALAEAWVGILAAADDLRVRLLRDRERAEVELAALEELCDGSRRDRLDEERTAVREAEVAVERTRDALAHVLDARMQLYVLAATELSLAEEHDDRLVQRESAEVLVDLAERRIDGRADSDAAQALIDRVPRGSAGPVPVVVVMGNAPAATLDRLECLPEDVQILVIGEGDGAEEWMDRVGDTVAATIDTGSLV